MSFYSILDIALIHLNKISHIYGFTPFFNVIHKDVFKNCAIDRDVPPQNEPSF